MRQRAKIPLQPRPSHGKHPPVCQLGRWNFEISKERAVAAEDEIGVANRHVEHQRMGSSTD
jgi:hypothetical protein